LKHIKKFVFKDTKPESFLSTLAPGVYARVCTGAGERSLAISLCGLGREMGENVESVKYWLECH
jgi:hypothetical protein